MNQKFTIALLQLGANRTEQENLSKGLQACESARELGAELAIFPELWNVGYQHTLFTAEHALDHHSDFIQQFRVKAKKLEMAIAITYLGKSSGPLPTNNVALIDRTGAIAFEYAKVNVCNFKGGCECGLQAGKDFYITPLAFKGGIVSVGAMICFDREFPDSARALACKGAEIIIVPNACKLVHDSELGDVRLQQIRARSFENMVVMAVANYPKPSYDGNSCVCSANGALIARAGTEEEILLAQVDLNELRLWRQRNSDVWGSRS